MLTKTKKVLLISALSVTILLNATGETKGETNSSDKAIEDIIKNSVQEETRQERKAREKAEREAAKAEKEAAKAAREAEKAEEKARRELEKNKKANEEIDGIINNEIKENNNNKNRSRQTDNNFQQEIMNQIHVEGTKQNTTNGKEQKSETNNLQVNDEVNQILQKRQQKTKKSAIDKSKPVVIAEDREKETATEYRDTLMKFIATKDGKILKTQQEKKLHPIASLTKVMNVIVALEQVDKGRASLDDNVCFTPETVNIGGSWLNVKMGDCLSLRDLLRAELIYSANNAAYLVAYHISKGNIDNYIKLMNDKARELGMHDTKFYTPAGLPTSMTGKDMDISTAYDMYLLGRKAIEDERIREWASETELVLLNDKGEQVVYRSRNHLLGTHGIYGLKTGFHNLSGFNIIVSSRLGNIDIISVVLGHATSNARTADQTAELAQIERSLKVIYSIGENMGKISVKNAKKKEIEGILADSVYELGAEKYEYKVKSSDVEAGKEGIKQGDVIGKLEVISNGEVISTVDILSTEDVKELSLLGKIIRFITFGLV